MRHDYLSEIEMWGVELAIFFVPDNAHYCKLSFSKKTVAFLSFFICLMQFLKEILPNYYFVHNDRILRILEEYDGRLSEYIHQAC